MSFYARFGSDDYLGEQIDQLHHAAQTADLAAAQGHGVDVICAAFLHDFGHLCGRNADAERMGEFGVAQHEHIGAAALSAHGFSTTVTRLVAGHVAAKRYLTRRKPEYHAQLSPASRRTLEYQGGPMTEAEAGAFDADPLAPLILTLRRWDEAAKAVSLPAPSLNRYRDVVRSHLRQQAARRQLLSPGQLAFWHTHGWLKIDGYLDAVQCALLNAWSEDLRQRPEIPGSCMKYFERSRVDPEQRLLCRIENFIQFHPGLAELIDGADMHALVSGLFAAPAALFKEKLNFKLPGSAGFAPHQDAPAFTSFAQTLHITVMVSVDATTPSNGCLEIAPHPGATTRLPMAPDLTIAAESVAALPWTAIPTAPGDLLIFDSYLPHRSAPNLTDAPRRALYLTYNKLAEGQVRDAYFSAKRAVFPPDVEREPGRDYGDAGVFNVGNPIR